MQYSNVYKFTTEKDSMVTLPTFKKQKHYYIVRIGYLFEQTYIDQ